MFEICSTQGKSERIFDLTVGGLDSSPQQSTIEGVQEVGKNCALLSSFPTGV